MNYDARNEHAKDDEAIFRQKRQKEKENARPSRPWGPYGADGHVTAYSPNR